MKLLRGESLARHGYWRLGGAADLFATIESFHEMEEAIGMMRALGLPITILGNGSNLLVADEGVEGLVLRLKGELAQSEVVEGAEGPELLVGAGLLNAVLLQRLDRLGLCGLPCLAGVPGTIGGAIRMNAGTALGEIGPCVLAVELVEGRGERRWVGPEQLHFSYRHARLPPGAFISRARLRLRAEGLEQERQRVAHHLARRKDTQPLELPSCGSVFKNPPGDHAGRLIEAAGLKGRAMGGARISEKHANFIVNEGGALAAEVRGLVRLARDEVWARFAVALEPEVHAIGRHPPEEWPLPRPAAQGLPSRAS